MTIDAKRCCNGRVVYLTVLCGCVILTGCGWLNTRPAEEINPFHAAEWGDLESLENMVAEDPDLLKRTNVIGESLLHRAAIGNQPEVISFLVKSGADIGHRNHMGDRAIHTAAVVGAEEAVKMLLRCGEDPNSASIIDGRKTSSVLDRAARHGRVNIVRYLLEQGALVVDSKHPHLDTALHWACRAFLERDQDNPGNSRVIDLLLSNFDDVNVRNFQRQTPLHVAAAYGRADTVDHLLKTYAKTEINAATPDGKTALHFAVTSQVIRRLSADQRAATVRVLLAHGAKLLPDFSGKTPLDLARSRGNKTIIDAFE